VLPIVQAAEIPQQKEIFLLIDQYAKKYSVDPSEMRAVINCESGFDPSTQSMVPAPSGPNGREDSWGLAQIHLPAHSDISRAQAVDPDFALNFMAYNFSVGNKSIWTCYTQLKSGGKIP
jgi:soluble lytic murein transglycosylase-like protein